MTKYVALLRGVNVGGRTLRMVELKACLETLGLQIVPFTTEDAELTAHLWAQTKSIGLSLGDRACLALGLRLGVSVFTTDRVWSSLAIGVAINVIR